MSEPDRMPRHEPPDGSREPLEHVRDQLLVRAHLHEDPDAYQSGVLDAIDAIGGSALGPPRDGAS